MGITLDVILLIALLGYVINGARRGFAHELGATAGVIAGGIGAFFLVPFVGTFIADSFWRVLASIGIFLALIVAGHAIGAAIGDAVRRGVGRTPLVVIDRILGAIMGGVVAALVMSLIAASVAPLGVPFVSNAVAQSTVLRTITQYTPDPVQSLLARVRAGVVRDTIPSIIGALDVGDGATTAPDVATGTRALVAAAASVVRVSGNAASCAQTQSGTGFVVAPGRVLTNAHVVAGVSDPVIEVMGGGAFAASVVYFDPTDDLAVLSVPHLGLDPLDLSPTLSIGDAAVYDGYPYGGPFVTGPAGIVDVGTQKVDDIYGTSSSPREIYTIAADIQEGDSGGPLLTTGGEVAGLVFAKSANQAGVGFAITSDVLSPIVDRAPGLTTRVGSGRCTRG